MDRKLHLDEISLLPALLTDIQSRSEITPLYKNNISPFWVSPMDSIIDVTNFNQFLSHGLNTILPRKEWEKLTVIPESPNFWVAFTLDEMNSDNKKINDFIDIFISINGKARILIDIANGHMKSLYETGKRLKLKYGENISLMGGNIANPDTIVIANEIFDYIRIGIGGGSRCLTSTKTGIHYPSASLIMDTKKIIRKNDLKVKIIMDGGISDIGMAIKSLALGADAVMMGRLFNSCIECSTPTKISTNLHTEIYNVNDKKTAIQFFKAKRDNEDWRFYNYYRGMSTKEVQQKEGKTPKTAEGFGQWNRIEFFLEEFVQELYDSLKSSMSYTNKIDLESYIGNVNYTYSNIKGHN